MQYLVETAQNRNILVIGNRKHFNKFEMSLSYWSILKEKITVTDLKIAGK